MTHKFAICLYQPDMPQNLGVIIRTAACLEFPLHIIKPLPFSMTDKRFKGAVMDYIDHCEIVNHENGILVTNGSVHQIALGAVSRLDS